MKSTVLSVCTHVCVVLFFFRFVNCMVYYALAMTSGNLVGNEYLGFSLSGLVEIPSLVLGYLIIDR